MRILFQAIDIISRPMIRILQQNHESKLRIGIKGRNIGLARSGPETENKDQYQEKALRVCTEDRDHKSYTILITNKHFQSKGIRNKDQEQGSRSRLRIEDWVPGSISRFGDKS